MVIKLCFSKNYTVDIYAKGLREVKFPNYENFTNANGGYSNFVKKLIEIIVNLTSFKNKRIKRNAQEWFDSVISEREKLFKKYKKSRLHINKEIYKRARYSAQNLISKKKKKGLENKLKNFVGKP